MERKRLPAIWRNKIFPIADRLVAVGALASAAVLAYATWVEPRWLEVTRIDVDIPALPKQFHNYTIVQISDIHAGELTPASRLEEAVRIANLESPDLVAITGDFVTYSFLEAPAGVLPALQKLRARDGVAAVLGNHDYWGRGDGLIRELIEQANIIDLNNRVRVIERQGARLHLAGVDSARERMARLALVLPRLPRGETAILLAHEPDFADIAAATGRFGLQLSGHSHGGQVVVPLLGPPRLPPMGKKYPAGLYRVEDMYLYTNRGLGVVGLPFRFFCRPEITVITLKSSGRPGPTRSPGEA